MPALPAKAFPPMSPAEFDAYIKKEVALNAALAKMAGLKANEQ